MKIDNVRIYGLEESIVASGLPMVEEYNSTAFTDAVVKIRMLREQLGFPMQDIGIGDMLEYTEAHDLLNLSRHLKRAKTLASCAGGESHDCFLAGVVVQCNVTAPRYWWPEESRYHFIDIISSTSTMHRLKHFVEQAVKIKENGGGPELAYLINAHFSKETWPVIIDDFLSFAEARMKQTEVNIEELKANLPEGWLQTARITTNYRQLKTVYRQRHNHGLKEWRDFCVWIESMPMAQDLILGGMKKEQAE